MLPAGDAQAPSTTAAVPMEVDQCATWQAASHTPGSPLLVLRLSGKLRRLHEEDGDDDPREQAEQLLEEFEAGPKISALWPSTASALPASVLAVYAHSVQRFTCTLCAYTASSFASLKRQRDSRHCHIAFRDLFSGALTTLRLCLNQQQGTSYPLLVQSMQPFQRPAQIPCCPAKTPWCLLPPPHAKTTDDRSTTSSWIPPLLRELVASRVASRLGDIPAPHWGPPLPSSVVVSRIADRPLPPELTEEEETEAGDSDDEDVNDPQDICGDC
uniref:C2H2-type domain-containing protein n=1 Tax=Peronospora matthiolae TaxID=2874970 RepID=A0AAV1TZ61_9STRA